MVGFDSPFVVFLATLAVQGLAAYAGDAFRKRVRPLGQEGEREDFDVVRTASLTLLGLLIGFSFAMAVSRYDQRKKLEADEANAIGTEYVRADFLSADDASRVRELLGTYCDERIAYYVARDELRVGQSDADTAKTQAELWKVVARVAAAQPTPIAGLVVAGMNDVLNSHTGCVVEPDTFYGLDADDRDCDRMQSVTGIWRAQSDGSPADFTACRIDVTFTYCGH
jgi:hypothetical protein